MTPVYLSLYCGKGENEIWYDGRKFTCAGKDKPLENYLSVIELIGPLSPAEICFVDGLSGSNMMFQMEAEKRFSNVVYSSMTWREFSRTILPTMQ